MSFKYYTLEDARCTTYFAFSFPYSYTELQTELNARDLQFRLSPPVDIYYHRELLTYTLDGRRVDLLTITAADGGEGREMRLPGLFPLALSEPRAIRFPGRKVVLLSARVHPGETPSSHVLNGCLRFLLSADARAARLRRLYVVKVVPMLNPDGVARGHYRTNIHGANLNRMYGDPTRALYPEVHAAKSVALYHHLGRVPAECEVLDSEPSVAEVDARFVRPRELAAPVPRPPELEDVSNDASCFCGGDDESSLGMPDLSPLKSLLQLTPPASAAPAAGRQQWAEPRPSAGSDSESLVSSGETESSAAGGSASTVDSGETTAVPSDGDSNLFLYVDMHGHASKRGCFMYGNHFSSEETMLDCMLLPKLVSLNSANFDFLACNFTEKNMHHKGKKDGLSKEGSGRVAIYRSTGLVRSYTLECNYNTGRFCNVLPPLPGEREPPADRPLVFEPVPYTPAHYEQVGEALMVSILDVTGDNPLSRLGRSEYRDTAGVRAWIRRFMQVTKFGENNILFSPEKTARTMKTLTSERQRRTSCPPEERSPTAAAAAGSPAGPPQRRLAPAVSPGRCGDARDRRRPARRLRKAKKLSPAKVEDQENAAVTPARKRSADAVLAAAAAATKADGELALNKDTQPDVVSLAGPSRLRVKSPVLQPRSGFGQIASPGNTPPGLTRKPAGRRALSEKRKVLKPTPVKLGESAVLGRGAPKLRRSASLVNAGLAEAPRPESSVVGNLNLILGDKHQVAGMAWADQLPAASGLAKPAKRAPKRRKRVAKPEEAAAPVPEALPPCRSLGHLIQLVSTPPVSFSNLFMGSASTGELESTACTVGYDESATLPDELPPGRLESCGSSPLSFAGALSSLAAEKTARQPRKKLARRASAPACRADQLTAIELLTSPTLVSDVTAAMETMRPKKKHAKLAKRPGLERGRLALQQVKKRKKMKEKV
ncbi:cytosolic carboxypeptidase-like protein 5 [Pollicipes pollicipes]|uniref:cytosolic carboxypeptidase-like protein 5 n=1 Tax=Pollicipes pollicipes TaxID=41117 RepID=UPI001884C1CB|nr:cytosolic carboxypeptidase-like protein 5 [Pollicipes pollicipes]